MYRHTSRSTRTYLKLARTTIATLRGPRGWDVVTPLKGVTDSQCTPATSASSLPNVFDYLRVLLHPRHLPLLQHQHLPAPALPTIPLALPARDPSQGVALEATRWGWRRSSPAATGCPTLSGSPRGYGAGPASWTGSYLLTGRWQGQSDFALA